MLDLKTDEHVFYTAHSDPSHVLTRCGAVVRFHSAVPILTFAKKQLLIDKCQFHNYLWITVMQPSCSFLLLQDENKSANDVRKPYGC